MALNFTKYNFLGYIYKVKIQLYPHGEINKDLLEEINYIFHIILYAILKKYSINSNLPNVIKTIFLGELGKLAISESIRAINHFGKYDSSNNINRSNLSGLQFPVLTTEYLICDFTEPNFKFSDEFIIYITAVLEYFCAELIYISGKHYSIKIFTLTIDDLKYGIKNDNILNNIFNRLNIIIGKRQNLYKIKIDKNGLINNEIIPEEENIIQTNVEIEDNKLYTYNPEEDY